MGDKARILVVDDEPLNVELLQAILEPAGYTVLPAVNGVQALKILSETRVDLVLLDVMMPLADGFEVTRRVRADEAIKGTPIILVTALHETSQKITGIEAGCDEFLTKPFDKREVLARVKTLLRLNYLRTQINEKEKFERVMDKMNDGLVVLDSGLRGIRSNQKGRELLGMDELSPGWIERLAKAFPKGYKGDLEHDLPLHDLEFDLERARTDDQGLLIVSVGSTVIRDSDGRTDSVVMILRDVTEQRLGQFLRGDFINLMSRKLRTPLAVSMEHLSLMQKASVPMVNSPFKKSVDITVGKVSEYLKMTEKIFDFLAADVSAGFGKKRPAPGSIGVDRIQDLVKAAIRDFPGKRVDCHFDFSGVSELPIPESPFTIIIRNLVENAIKFNNQSVTKLAISAVRDGESVCFVVADNGPGIPGGERVSVFDALRPAPEQGEGRPGRGLGLGLALVGRIVTANNGAIRIDDNSVAGTSVRMTLPLAEFLVPV